ncbi:AMSH-like ubiquitin thioesterase 2 isoform X2 [Mangifera indica]|uniref:AMSH-like ubiquitin thioesterase 2 isoform X2 n=1 Tax=Mangifera indica TaxID=29780 RepID=UPI001CFBD6ED|nr:AMSH-like ubiquitin thioesterase 2 isoform X2 [Mangifera indica]
MYQLVKEKEPSAGNDAGSQKVHNHLGVTKRKVESCDTAETTCQSLKIINNDKSGSTRQRITVHAVTQSHPSPVLSLVESVPQGAHITHIKVDNSDKRAHNEPSSSKVLQDVHISGQLMEDFLELAKDNTDKDLETCGVLGAFLENRTFYVTTLIIPKQDSTSSSCQAVNEEEVFAIQNERSLFPVGWIHKTASTEMNSSVFFISVFQTHPSQSCFMSSVDLHTQYSYQAMVPEAFAIVVAPTDSSRSSGIFRLTDPCGMSVLKNCQEDGFHPHKEPADGCPIYENCSNVYTNSNLRFEIFDLR